MKCGSKEGKSDDMNALMDAVAVSRYHGDRMTTNVESRTEWEELKQQQKL